MRLLSKQNEGEVQSGKTTNQFILPAQTLALFVLKWLAVAHHTRNTDAQGLLGNEVFREMEFSKILSRGVSGNLLCFPLLVVCIAMSAVQDVLLEDNYVTAEAVDSIMTVMIRLWPQELCHCAIVMLWYVLCVIMLCYVIIILLSPSLLLLLLLLYGTIWILYSGFPPIDLTWHQQHLCCKMKTCAWKR